jgi:hypothetical protein
MIGDRWGVSELEVSRSYPCDDFVASATMQAWRGVYVEAPAEAVWPWVAQVRLAPYSYDWIDNLGRRSPRDLAGLPEARAGDRFTTVGGRALGRIVSVDPGKQLTGVVMAAFMSYVLVPQEQGGTRLLLKVVMRTARWAAPWLSAGDLIMARRQLLNLKQLAERGHPARRGRFPTVRRELCGLARVKTGAVSEEPNRSSSDGDLAGPRSPARRRRLRVRVSRWPGPARPALENRRPAGRSKHPARRREVPSAGLCGMLPWPGRPGRHQGMRTGRA